jgi:two-component system phosphate regulon sensor histidine kinase PhoR
MWAALVVPSAVCAMLLGPAAAWFVGPWAAAVVFGVCLSEAVLLGWVVERFRRHASAQLRRPEVRGSASHQTGVFGPLLSEALLRIEELENRAAVAAGAKTELEARLHVARRRQRHFAGAVDALGEAILLTDVAGRVLHANPAACRLFFPGDSVAGKSNGKPGELDLKSIPAVATVVRQIVERPAANSRSAEFGVEGSEAVTHRATARPVFDEDGSLLGTAVHVADVRGENAERQRHAEFVSSVSHELKTPMASIKAYAELLRDGDAETPEERDELCGFIEAQVDRLTRLVNNMLNLARIQSGVIKVHREDCELNDLLQPAVETVRQLAEEKNIRIVSELSNLYLAVHVDKDLLNQAVVNLLSNAIKYTPPGGEVRLRSRADSDRVVIDVKDTGMGIPPESLPRLFERFYRVPRNNAAAAGTGLGLALVKYITADLHNGSIAVQSEVDKGSTFSVSLPFGHRNKLPRRDSGPAKPAELPKAAESAKSAELPKVGGLKATDRKA